MARFVLTESCEVDDGSLDGLTPQQCFVLGTEWHRFLDKLRDGRRFAMVVHEKNSWRLTRMAERRNRFVEPHFFLARCIQTII